MRIIIEYIIYADMRHTGVAELDAQAESESKITKGAGRSRMAVSVGRPSDSTTPRVLGHLDDRLRRISAAAWRRRHTSTTHRRKQEGGCD